MKPIRLFAVPALALGLLAPAAAAQTAPPPAPVPGDVVANPRSDWWRLDPEKDQVRGAGVERAWRELLAGKRPRRSVVVAIIDSGVDISHPDLKDVIWTNPREVAGNGRDDDGNGYVDDVHGWDFIGGRDGRDVQYDTYEGTRLYAACTARYGTAIPDTATVCQRVAAKQNADRAEAIRNLEQVKQIARDYEQVSAALRQALNGDSLTVEKVRALRPFSPALQQGRDWWLRLADAGITAEVIREEQENLAKRVQYGMNPAFDPRGIVGDNYENVDERGYGNPEVTGPDASHGTHVAGIVAAVRGNGVGIDGIASPVAKIMVLRAVPDGDERDKDVANAIRYAVDNGAQIINMSFGKAWSPRKDAVDAAVRYAEQKGVLLVHAAGNEGADVAVSESFPTRYYRTGGGAAGNWIEVGASSWGAADSLAAAFSNWNRERVDVFAPGVSILSTTPGGKYERFEGTSMAAPVVSGVAALVMAYYPELTPAQVRQVLMESATRFADQQVARPGSEGERIAFGQLSSSGGVVNAYAALRLAEQRAGSARR